MKEIANSSLNEPRATSYSSIISPQERTAESNPVQPVHISTWHIFKRHLPNLILTIIVDVILPIVFYFVLQIYIAPVYAISIAASPPLIMMIIKCMWSHTFDAIGFIVVTALTISAIVTIAIDNPRIMIIEKPCTGVVLLLAFIISLIPIRVRNFKLKPIIFYFYVELLPMEKIQIETDDVDDGNNFDYKELTEDDALPIKTERYISEVYEWIYEHCPNFRLCCYQLTILWCINFSIEVVGGFLIYFSNLNLNAAVIYANLVVQGSRICFAIITIIFVIRERRETLRKITR
ncbi:unnamed protein product [Didymodactylos carnosus]|uniref:Uncharacterized protein n=1 Tax=Didymodactylos carnosus TaxID=1234261 RepID=A0A815ULW0_9BILA|nr:unnamed protein product [Didymodactylos carnosus]CAF1522567.1 unnamed protein product [Didymodactylos carnosus]CAF4214117.1 unnamed protein product [Didymodactylos carnosus]CAF4381683.1 unnamed protein product [Didymodactylos carnosus]